MTTSDTPVTVSEDGAWIHIYQSLLYLIQQGQSVYTPPFYERLPTKFIEHSCNTSGCSFPVIVMNEACSSSLDLFSGNGEQDDYSDSLECPNFKDLYGNNKIWQNQQNQCAPSEDSDQTRQMSSLGTQSFCWFCHVAAHITVSVCPFLFSIWQFTASFTFFSYGMHLVVFKDQEESNKVGRLVNPNRNPNSRSYQTFWIGKFSSSIIMFCANEIILSRKYCDHLCFY